MTRLWRALSNHYGVDVWERKFPPEAMATWEDALGAFTINDLKRGVAACKKDTQALVPRRGLGYFIGLCRAHASPAHKPFETVGALLEQLPAGNDSPIAKREIALCRKLASGKKLTKDELSYHPPAVLADGTKLYAKDVADAV